MCADLLREVLGRALGGREPAKTLLLSSRFGGPSARSRVGAYGDSNTRERAATSRDKQGSGVAKTGGAESLFSVWENQTQTLSCFC